MTTSALPAHAAPAIDQNSLHFTSHTFTGQRPGPRLIVSGAVHGNEVCGPLAIGRVLADIAAGSLNIVAGSVTFVPVANPLAHALGTRVGERNLNRNLFPTARPQDFEDRITNWLCPLLAQHDVLIDLHSTHAENPAFAMLGPRNNTGSLQPFAHEEKERALALHLGVNRFVDGWLETYAKGVERRKARVAVGAPRSQQLGQDPRYGVGTTEFMRSVGGCAITLECGSHTDPQSPEVGYRAICNALAFLGLSDGPKPAPVTQYEALSIVDVIDKHHADDQFSQAWASFMALEQGAVIGRRSDGAAVLAGQPGRILFPDAKALPGNEWFYLTRSMGAI